MTVERLGRRVLVTGGSGFVGTNLINDFVGDDWDARNFDIAPPRNEEHRDRWKLVDILDRDQLIDATRDLAPRALVHLAARTDLNEHSNLAGYAANIDGVCNVIDAIRATTSIERVIFASSQLVCELGYQPRDEYDYRPTTLYGRSKVLGERIVRAAHDIGATWTIVRPTSLWGPWFGTPFRPMFEWIRRGLYLHPVGVHPRKQWGFVGNSSFQIRRLLDAPRSAVHGRMFYLADYEPVDLYDFVQKARRELNAPRIRRVPPRVLKAVARVGDVAATMGWRNVPLSTFRFENLVRDEIQDVRPLRELVGPLPHSLEDGIAATVGWLAGSSPRRE